MLPDYLALFHQTLEVQIAREGQGSERAAAQLRKLFPQDLEANDDFVPGVRQFALKALDLIVDKHASRHGKQRPIGGLVESVRWLSDQIESAAPSEKHYLSRVVLLAGDIINNHGRGEALPLNDHDLCSLTVMDAGLMAAQLAVATRLDYKRGPTGRSSFSRKLAVLCHDETNYGWEAEVLVRIEALLPSLTTNRR